MAKDKLTDYSATNASNTDVGGINIDEGMLPSAVNNSIRELMTHLKNFSDGTDAIDALAVTGDLTVDTNTLHVDAANNRVGVGVASPSHPLHVAQSRASDVVGLIENTNTTSGFGLKIKAGGTDADRYSLRVDSQAGTELFRVRTAGGVTFNGDTAAANALDDYEVGTWTPDIGGNSVVYSRDGRYVKVGDMVFANFQFALTSRGTGSQTTLSGLPYNSLSTGQAQSGQISYFANIGTACVFVGCYVTNNSSQILFTGGVSSANTITRNGFTVFADSCNIIGCAVYRAA